MISFNPQNNLPAFLILIILINAAGYLLRFFSYDTYFIFLGFRFHISILIFIFLLGDREFISFLKRLLVKPGSFNLFSMGFIILLPALIIGGSLLLMKEIRVAKPDNFYELGISSLIDYPIYLIWNFPNIAAIIAVIMFSVFVMKKKIISSAFIFFLIYISEFIPIDFEKIDYFPIISFVFFSLSIGLLLKRFQNLYFLSALIFTSIWLWILGFGCDNKLFINLFLAAQYKNWEGFFLAGKTVSEFLTIGAILIFLFAVFLNYLFSKKIIEKTN
ncbi:MAG TPA: hypothetical protein PKA80_04510 [Ignavibacteriaceae bacterium]|nr:hypothetical protein [Ignavibacteriaceae bacterium]